MKCYEGNLVFVGARISESNLNTLKSISLVLSDGKCDCNLSKALRYVIDNFNAKISRQCLDPIENVEEE